MGHSREEKAQSRERILSAASRMIREDGFESLSVADLMKAANLTHGGFYGHFSSREDMIVAGLERALEDGENAATAGKRGKSTRTVKAVLNGYLSAAHRDHPGAGCATASVAGDVARAQPSLRKVMTTRMDNYIDSMAEAYGDHRNAEEFAAAAWCTMVGAIVLSRVYAGTPKSDRILAAARNSILAMEDTLKRGK
jgi:TetR/AcrR family transcriptional repressor of nem operon